MFSKIVRQQHFSLKKGGKGDMCFDKEWEGACYERSTSLYVNIREKIKMFF